MTTHSRIFHLMEASGRLPEPPASLQEALRLMDTPGQMPIDTLADAIGQDEVMAGIVLKKMNSPFYAPSMPARSLREAIVLLGAEPIRNLMVYRLSLLLVPDMHRQHNNFIIQSYWQHALAAAIAADNLAARIGAKCKFRLFTYGLVHDLGILALQACLPEKLDAVVDRVRNGVPQMVAERAVLGGITHANIGAWLCRRWHLPEDLRTVVEFHHTPTLVQHPSRELRLLYIGNILSTRLYETCVGYALGDSPMDAHVLRSLRLSVQAVRAVEASLAGELAAFHKAYIAS